MTEQELIQLRHKLSEKYKVAVVKDALYPSSFNTGYRIGIEFALECLGYTNTMLDVLAHAALSEN
jgi:hypothetical protein